MAVKEPEDKRNRKLRRLQDKVRSKCRGCLKNERQHTDTGRTSPGLHSHGRAPQAHDHASGTDFVADKSTTRAVARRNADMFWLLKGEVPPLLDDPRRAEAQA